jgi:hypothetical protein
MSDKEKSTSKSKKVERSRKPSEKVRINIITRYIYTLSAMFSASLLNFSQYFAKFDCYCGPINS